jgi:uncharacterized membrane protein YfcA
MDCAANTVCVANTCAAHKRLFPP